jgi:hypothetical protein
MGDRGASSRHIHRKNYKPIARGSAGKWIDMSMKYIHTIGMKVAISVPDELFKAVDRLAKLNKVSRSRIFAQAVREHLKKMESRQLLRKLNEAWEEPLTADEAATLRLGQELTWDAIEKEPHGF